MLLERFQVNLLLLPLRCRPGCRRLALLLFLAAAAAA
jgi:hypothetical protein